MLNIRKYNNNVPIIADNCYIDISAVIIGNVEIDKNSSIWCNSVIRGDVSYIKIGANTNIQDLTTLHVTHYRKDNDINLPDKPIIIGDNVTVGHNCCLHACHIKNNVLIGMGSTILDGATINSNVIIGAGSLVTSNKIIESGYLYHGNPLKQIRKLTLEEIEFIEYSAKHYVKLKNNYLEQDNGNTKIFKK
jgi:carbonic anhydrase/acetyltransferase-like protein (isoleucine patch superfamily)